MRHRKAVAKLGRTASHRKATLMNLSTALFEKKHIITTEAKAKETRRVAEKLITLAKNDTVHARRVAAKFLRHKDAVRLLFTEIAPQYTERPGGYTRVVKLGQRDGDAAHMAVLELVGFDTATKKKKAKEAKEDADKDSKKKKAKASEEGSAKEEKKTEKKSKAKKDDKKTEEEA